MELLKSRIQAEGLALTEKVLKVDSFLNHQVDPHLMKQMGDNFAHYFGNKQITKVFTIESSGIAPAVMTALKLDVPLVTLKKQASKILNQEVLQTEVRSFTKDLRYLLTLSKNYITPDDNILIIDDFLAMGEAALGAARLVEEANATVAGIGIVIEKSFQPGRQKLEEAGYEVYSLARIQKLGAGLIEFVEE